MSFDLVLYLTLGALAGGFVNGLSGTGTALFALGFYLVVLDPIRAVAIVAFVAVLTGLQGVWAVRANMLAQPGRLLRFVLPGLAGVPIGLSLLSVIDARQLSLAIALLLILYGGYFGFRTALPAFSRPTPWIDAGIGLTGGILGGSTSVSGAIPAMWLSIRPWPKGETRAILQHYNIAILGTTVGLLLFQGAYDRTTLLALIVTIPCGLIAAQIGIMVFKRLSDTAFRRLLILLTLLMGVGLMAREIL